MFEMDLRELAINRMGLSSSYNVAQMKRGLLKGIEELEQRWDLRPLPPEKRFLKIGRGNWSIRFERKRRPAIPSVAVPIIQPVMDIDPTQLQFALTKRGIGPASAEELSQAYPAQSIKLMIELYDWYNQRGQSRGAGFLVQSIKNPQSIELPVGFESSQQVQTRQAAEKNRICVQRDFSIKRERIAAQAEESRSQAFMAFWQGMSPTDQLTFERMALDNAEPTKRTGYSRHQGKGGRLFEHYRQVILRDHFERATLCAK